MRNKARVLSATGIAVAILATVVFLTLPAETGAKTVAVEGMAYDVNASLVDNLKPLVGKQVTVTLQAGGSFKGVVKVVGKHLLHLEKLEGREYFDALISMENIIAIDARFREFAR